MAIYHAKLEPIKRSAGRSMTAVIAYRAGIQITDARTGETADYRPRRGVIDVFTLLPNAGVWHKGHAITGQLWQNAEAAERRRNAVVGREWELAIPHELGVAGAIVLAHKFADHLASSLGVAVTVAIHAPSATGDERNLHLHVCHTSRRVAASIENNNPVVRFGEKTRELDDRARGPVIIREIRQTWQDLANIELEKGGFNERIDCRSLADRGIDRPPHVHLGPAATALERRGIRTRPGDYNRAIDVGFGIHDIKLVVERFGEILAECGISTRDAHRWADVDLDIDEIITLTDEEVERLLGMGAPASSHMQPNDPPISPITVRTADNAAPASVVITPTKANDGVAPLGKALSILVSPDVRHAHPQNEQSRTSHSPNSKGAPPSSRAHTPALTSDDERSRHPADVRAGTSSSSADARDLDTKYASIELMRSICDLQNSGLDLPIQAILLFGDDLSIDDIETLSDEQAEELCGIWISKRIEEAKAAPDSQTVAAASASNETLVADQERHELDKEQSATKPAVSEWEPFSQPEDIQALLRARRAYTNRHWLNAIERAIGPVVRKFLAWWKIAPTEARERFRKLPVPTAETTAGLLRKFGVKPPTRSTKVNEI